MLQGAHACHRARERERGGGGGEGGRERTHGCAIVERFSVHSGSHGGKSVGNLSGPGGFDCAALGVGAKASATHALSLRVDAMAAWQCTCRWRGAFVPIAGCDRWLQNGKNAEGRRPLP